MCYEGIFLHSEIVKSLFISQRGENKLRHETSDFHVTTEFMPKLVHPDWYGSEVDVILTSYARQTVRMDNGELTVNEGFGVSVSSSNGELNDFLKSLKKNFHITGGFDHAPKYTEDVDFSLGDKIEVIHLKGTFECRTFG